MARLQWPDQRRQAMTNVNQGHVIGLTAEMEQARQKADKPVSKQKSDKTQEKVVPASEETKTEKG